jgi:hypothetical protein
VKKSFINLAIVALVFLLLVGVASAKSSYSSTFGFGGKVIEEIKGVTCSGGGTVIVVSSNVDAVVGTVSSVFGNGSTGQKIVGGISNLSKIVPYYATNTAKKPRKGQYILGKAESVIDTSTCKIESSKTSVSYSGATASTTTTMKSRPFPVRKTNIYSVSGGISSVGASQGGTSGYSTYTSNGVINYE